MEQRHTARLAGWNEHIHKRCASFCILSLLL